MTTEASNATNLAVLTRTVEDLEEAGVTFADEQDDLGAARTAHVAIGTEAFLLDHIEGSPNPGVTVLYRGHTSDPVSELERLLEHLHIPQHAVRWYWTGTDWQEGPLSFRPSKSA